MTYGQVYTDFLQFCRPARPPLPWERFRKNADFWAPPASDEAMLAALQGMYSRQDLIRSGVAIRDEGKTLIINPIFLQIDCKILPLRPMPQSNPFDLLTSEGTSSRQLSAYAAAHDYLVQKGINKRGFLFLTFSMQDLMSLRAVGMPTALATGLMQITQKSLKEFRALLGSAGPDDSIFTGQSAAKSPPPSATSTSMLHPEQSAMDPLRLIFVGWTPSLLSPHRPSDADQVIHNVTKIGSSFDVDLNAIFLWRPTIAEIRRIHFCLTQGSRKDVTVSILKSLDQSALPIAPAQNENESSGDFLRSRARLHEALSRPGSSSNSRRRRLREYQDAVDSTFVKPVMDVAEGTSDPDERSRLGGLAAVNRILYPNIELYLAKFERAIAKAGPRGDSESLATRELMKIFDALYRFTKESK